MARIGLRAVGRPPHDRAPRSAPTRVARARGRAASGDGRRHRARARTRPVPADRFSSAGGRSGAPRRRGRSDASRARREQKSRNKDAMHQHEDRQNFGATTEWADWDSNPGLTDYECRICRAFGSAKPFSRRVGTGYLPPDRPSWEHVGNTAKRRLKSVAGLEQTQVARPGHALANGSRIRAVTAAGMMTGAVRWSSVGALIASR
jgi:hypothetical protein